MAHVCTGYIASVTEVPTLTIFKDEYPVTPAGIYSCSPSPLIGWSSSLRLGVLDCRILETSTVYPTFHISLESPGVPDLIYVSFLISLFLYLFRSSVFLSHTWTCITAFLPSKCLIITSRYINIVVLMKCIVVRIMNHCIRTFTRSAMRLYSHPIVTSFFSVS
jgi:hypothetical protein